MSSPAGSDNAQGLYKGPANRILRKRWSDLEEFAEELWTIFQTPEVLGTGKVSLTQQDPAVTPLDINQPGYSTVPAITITQKGKDGVTNTITLGAQQDGSFNIEINNQPIASEGGGGFPGIVQSGTGSSYLVQITKSTGTVVVTAIVPQIAGGETVPAGTGCIVVQVGTLYYFQPAVWLP